MFMMFIFGQYTHVHMIMYQHGRNKFIWNVLGSLPVCHDDI